MMLPYFNPDQFMSDYFTKGFYIFNARSTLAYMDAERFKVVIVEHEDNCFHAEGHEYHSNYQVMAIRHIRKRIQGWYLIDIKNEMEFDFYAEKPNDHVMHWHSDAQYAMPGQNATINCFFNDCDETTGGRFDMMPFDAAFKGTIQEDERMQSVYPQKFSIIIFNQNRNFLHKVTACNSMRRMISYACTFPEFNPILKDWT